MIRIAIVDDQTEAISGILSVFQQWEKENHVYFEIDTYTDADLFCDAIFDKKYQALFLDLDMPKKSGFDISQFLRELGNNTPIVYITNRDDLMQKAFQYKVLGFVRKDKIQEELPFAISCVVQEIQKKNSHVMIFAAHRQKKEYYNFVEDRVEETLSDFEKQVLHRYTNGESYTQIAERLNAPVKSVDNAIQRIRKKTVKNILNYEE